MIASTIVLTIPFVASSAPGNCQDNEHSGLNQPDVLSMPDEVISMQQGIPPLPPVGMMMRPPFSFEEKPLPPFLHGLDLTESQQDKIFEVLHSQQLAIRV
jgi:hypothetical protein